jgi:hypothetical protein
MARLTDAEKAEIQKADGLIKFIYLLTKKTK